MLLQHFNALLPRDRRIQCTTDVDEVELITIITPTGAHILATSGVFVEGITSTEDLRKLLPSEVGWDDTVAPEGLQASCVLELLQSVSIRRAPMEPVELTTTRLQELDNQELDKAYRKKCLRCLRLLAKTSKALPPSFFLHNITVGSHPIEGGGFSVGSRCIYCFTRDLCFLL